MIFGRATTQASKRGTAEFEVYGVSCGIVTVTRACILVVDDEPTIRHFLQTLLRDEGYRVVTAINGLDALQQLGCEPNLILLDLQMPTMNGFEFLGRLRNMTGRADTPVLVVTANPSDATVAGAQRVLKKPFDVTTLLTHVSELLSAPI